MGNERPSFDTYFIAGAQWAATRGDCRRSQVGSIIVGTDRGVISTAYNGTKNPGEPGCLAGACPRGQKSYSEVPPGGDYGSCIARHSEANCILWARKRGLSDKLPGSTIYVTRAPCDGCQKLIQEAKIYRAVYPGGEMRWPENEL